MYLTELAATFQSPGDREESVSESVSIGTSNEKCVMDQNNSVV
jgi:hypothetical protein